MEPARLGAMAVLSANLAGEESSGEEGCCSDDERWEVHPDDSASARGPRRSGKAKLGEGDLARLRVLVQRDERFGRALEGTCNAVHEVVAAGNPGPVLTLLAGLVWKSLCVAWELDTGVPKAKLRADAMRVGDELKDVKVEFQDARRSYLKELVGLRDQVRRIDQQWLVEVSNVVYVEDPVMYYEPMKHLDVKVREHVAEVVEEKLKLLLSKLKGDKGKVHKNAGTSPCPEDLSGKIAAEDARAALKAAQQASRKAQAEAKAEAAKRAEAEAALEEARQADARADAEAAKLRARIRTLEDELHTLESETQDAWEQLADLAEGHQKQLIEAPQDSGLQRRRTSMRQQSTDSSGGLSGEGSTELSAAFDVARPARATRHVRHASLALLQELIKPQKVVETKPDPSISSNAAAAEAAARRAADAEAKAEEAAAREAARAERLAQELAALRAELAGALARALAAEEAFAAEAAAAAAARSAAEAAAVAAGAAAAAAGIDPAELKRVRNENVALRREIEHLRALLEQLSAGATAEEMAGAIAASGISIPHHPALKWKKPGGNVFVRLFQDALDRTERRRNLHDRVQQARAEEILEALKAELLESLQSERGGAEGSLAPEETPLLMRLLSIRPIPSLAPRAGSPACDILPSDEDEGPEGVRGERGRLPIRVVVDDSVANDVDSVRFSARGIDVTAARPEFCQLGLLSPRHRRGACSPSGSTSRLPSRNSSGSPSPKNRGRNSSDYPPPHRARDVVDEHDAQIDEDDDEEDEQEWGAPHRSGNALGVAGRGLSLGGPFSTALDALRGAALEDVSSIPQLSALCSQACRPSSATAVGSAAAAAAARAARRQGPASLPQVHQFQRAAQATAFAGSRDATLVREAQRLLFSQPGAAPAAARPTSAAQALARRSPSAPTLGALVGRRPPSAPMVGLRGARPQP